MESCGRADMRGFGLLRIAHGHYRVRMREAKKHTIFLDIDGPCSKHPFKDVQKAVVWWRSVKRIKFVCDTLYRDEHMLGDMAYAHVTLELRNGVLMTPDPHPRRPEPERAPCPSRIVRL